MAKSPKGNRGIVTPLRTYVVKVASRCNLNCDYCYMYNLQDRSYRDQPTFMSDPVRDALACRIVRHSRTHALTSVHIILHGGEPLLMGKDRLRSWVEGMRELLEPETRPYFSIQSNGVLVDAEWVELLSALSVRIGISVDGPRQVHDLHRRDHAGRGSFDDVVRAIRLLQSHPRGRDVFSTVMAVVDVNLPPAELFEFWQYLGVTGFDISLPHANHAHPPPAPVAAYGDWLIEFFDLWWDENRPDRRLRYFENMLRMFCGFPISTDNIGGKAVDVVVVETDGSIEPTDAFKCCFDGATKMGLNVLRDDFDAVANSPLVTALQSGSNALCPTCQECEFRDVCGGGYMPHRYGRDGSFDHPSVYCEALTSLLQHMANRIQVSLANAGIEV